MLIFCTGIFSAEYDINAVKAEWTLRLISHISWPNESRDKSFTIAFIGENAALYEQLRATFSERKIRGKTIDLVPIDRIEGLEAFHVLFVAKDTPMPFSEVTIGARGTNTLVISSEQSDQIHIMINFRRLVNGRLSFEFNRPNILLEQLLISEDILLIGGAELDVAKLYRDMEESMSELRGQLEITKKLSNLANSDLEQSKSQLITTKFQLVDLRAELSTLNTTLTNQQVIVNNQQSTIAARRKEFETFSTSAEKKLTVLVRETEQLSQQMRDQQQSIVENENLLATQRAKIAVQTSNLDKQLGVIRDQQLYIFIGLGLLGLFLLLVFILIRLSRDRARISLELKKRSATLEEEVIDRTAHYRALSDLSPVGVFQTDILGCCRYVNDRWCEYSGLTREQAMGSGWISAIHPSDKLRFSSPLDMTAAVFNSEYRYLTPNGETRWFLGRCDAEYGPDEELRGYIGTVTDITEQRLLEDQVRRTQKMDALGKLTGGIAHDYNNMLQTVNGFAELLHAETDESSDHFKWIEHILHAANRGTELTQKLLSFSKVRSSDAISTDINSLLEYQREIIEKTLTPRIDLVLNLEKSLWQIWLDAGELEDAILNMGINAMHAIEGNGCLSIKTENVYSEHTDFVKLGLPPGDYVLLSISDTGIGMDEDTKERLFDPFYTTKGTNGTGLGLTQVYAFVKRSNGFITVESRGGGGTKFSIYLPRQLDVQQEHIAELDHVVGKPGGNETVLIVDDEPAILALAETVLRQNGYQPVSANNAELALQILRDTPVEIMVSDVIMPGMDGFQLANIVRKNHPATKILLVSGYAGSTDKAEENAHFNVLQKPYKPEILVSRIRQVLDTGD